MADKLAPRPGVEVHQRVDLSIGTKTLTERQEAKLEQEINDEFVEPTELGELSHTFRSEVEYSLFTNEIIIQTTTSFLDGEEIERMVDIVQETMDVNVKSWQVEGSIKRKSLSVDML